MRPQYSNAGDTTNKTITWAMCRPSVVSEAAQAVFKGAETERYQTTEAMIA